MNKAFSKYIKNYPVGYALLAALLFGLNAPLSKLLLDDVPPLFMAAFLYLGAGPRPQVHTTVHLPGINTDDLGIKRIRQFDCQCSLSGGCGPRYSNNFHFFSHKT